VGSVEADLAAVVLAAVTSAVFVADRARMVFGGSVMNSFDTRPLVKHIASAACVFLLASSMVSCSKSQSPQVAQKSFASPEEAGAALLESAKTGDENSLLAIFGPDGKSLFSSGDPVKDKDTLQDFVAAYNQMHRWSEIKAGGEICTNTHFQGKASIVWDKFGTSSRKAINLGLMNHLRAVGSDTGSRGSSPLDFA
jgi:hypothetical protein